MKSPLLLKFILSLLVFILIIAAIAAYPIYKLAEPKIFEALGESLLFYYLLTIGMFGFITFNGLQNKKILNRFMLSIGLKMFIGLIYFVVLLKSFKGFALGFTLSFLSSYLICTFFEIHFLFTNLRQNSDAPNNANK